jgi:hypothetical protein
VHTLKLQRFTKFEPEVLEEYVDIMGPIAARLDKLQGESECYLCLLMPAVLQVVKKLPHASAGLTHLQSFVDRLKQSIETRFEQL